MASVPNMPSLGLPAAKGKAAPASADPTGFARQIAGVPQELLAALTSPGGAAADAEAAAGKAKLPTDPDAAPTDAAQLAALVSQAQAILPAPTPPLAVAKAETPAIAAAAAPALPALPQASPAKAKGSEKDQEAADPDGAAPEADAAAERPMLAAAKHMLDAAPAPVKATAAKATAAKAAAPQIADKSGSKAAPSPANDAAAPQAQSAAEISTATAPTPPLPQADFVLPAVATAPDAAPAPVTTPADKPLDLGDQQWLDRLARDIAQSASGSGTIQFRLHPQMLGHLRVELSQGDHGTSVRLTADTEQARAILADAQPRLAAEARAQGVRIAECHVDLSGTDRQASGDPRRQDDARQTPLIRTARDASGEAGADAPAPGRAGRNKSERYA